MCEASGSARKAQAGSDDDEEEDYMSDAFLTGLQDVRPGLITSRNKITEKQQVAQREFNKQKKQSVSQKATERLKEGLKVSVAIPENKGFALMAKMGYKPGEGLGAEGRKGRSEPIPLELRDKREGFGALEARKRRCEAYIDRATKRARNMDQMKGSFRAAQSERFRAQNVHRDLLRARRLCEQLDRETGYTEPPFRDWCWPKPEPKEGEAVEEEEEETVDEKDRQLNFLVQYLRNDYFHCLWCAVRYSSQDDLDDDCPGLEKDDHG